MIDTVMWKEFLPEYEISNDGRARRKGHWEENKLGKRKWMRERELKANRYKTGYFFFRFAQGEHERMAVHRCVAISFIPNPSKHCCVNHIDGNKSNNHFSNLEWVSHSENNRHSYRILGRIPYWKGKMGAAHKSSRSVEKLDDSGKVIAVFVSGREASNHAGVDPCGVTKAIREGYKVKGFRYRVAK